jgi:apolipoprotein N-acyltransferase
MQYYGFPYLIPPTILLFASAYALLFFGLSYWKNIYIRATLLILLNLIEPFGFNWFKPSIIFINSPFGTQLYQFGLIVFGMAFFIESLRSLKAKRYIFLSLSTLSFILAIDFSNMGNSQVIEPHQKIAIIETDILQSEKWLPENQQKIIKMNLAKIEEAISNGYDIVVLPESTFPLYLNQRLDILRYLKELSYEITIWTGSLYSEGENFYNSSYIFQNGEMQIAKKVVLVPFGEYIPLPKFLSNWINEIFFDGLKDFTPATKPTDINISGETFRNAICYEATSEKLFEDNPKFMIAISNNGWFLPSIEPTLQRLLMQHYSNIYKTTIFHSANREGTAIISPKHFSPFD